MVHRGANLSLQWSLKILPLKVFYLFNQPRDPLPIPILFSQVEVNNLLKINHFSKACNPAALLRKSLLYEDLVQFLLFSGILEHLTIDDFAFHVGDL